MQTNEKPMKRIISMFVFIIASCSVMSARKVGPKEVEFREYFPYKYEVRAGWGGYPSYDANCFSEGMFWRMAKAYREPAGHGDAPELNHMYGTTSGAEYMTGFMSAEFSFNFRHWFSLAIEAGFNGMWGNTYDKYDGQRIGTARGVSFAIMPHARIYWVNRKYVRFYTGFGLGVALGKYDGYFEVYPSAQFSPVGLTAGKKVFFFAEGSVGTAYMGGKFGVGYRF